MKEIKQIFLESETPTLRLAVTMFRVSLCDRAQIFVKKTTIYQNGM